MSTTIYKCPEHGCFEFDSPGDSPEDEVLCEAFLEPDPAVRKQWGSYSLCHAPAPRATINDLFDWFNEPECEMTPERYAAEEAEILAKFSERLGRTVTREDADRIIRNNELPHDHFLCDERIMHTAFRECVEGTDTDTETETP